MRLNHLTSVLDIIAEASTPLLFGERGGSVVECRTPEREVRGSKPTAAVLCPWASHFTPRKYWLITQEAMAPSRYDWKIVDWDVKPQHNQPTIAIFPHTFWKKYPESNRFLLFDSIEKSLYFLKVSNVSKMCS